MASYSLLTAGSQGASFSNTGIAAAGGSNTVTLPTLFSSNVRITGPITLSNAVTSFGAFTHSNTFVSFGNVGVGAAAPAYPLTVSTASNNVSIYASYDITAFSDARVKTNLQRIEDGMAKVGRISGYTYNRVEDPAGERLCGLLAQELQQVLPEAVHAHPDTGLLSVSYGNVASLFVEALKDLKAELKTVNARLDAANL